MIGVFDSGVGGLCAYKELRRLLPREDIIYLADSKNSPYGTKTKDEIIALTKANIKKLSAFGAEKILIACCTASSVHSELLPEEQRLSIPIISPAARLAGELGERIAVIATNHTANSGAFSREIRKTSEACVFEFAEQKLVALVEGGCRDGRVSSGCKEELLKIKNKIQEVNADVLILGCTHFSHLEGELKWLLPEVNIISPAREGARELIKKIKCDRAGCGREIYM